MIEQTTEANINLINSERIIAYSRARLEAYRIRPTDGIGEILINYYWNIALCEALYPVLQTIEVVLRNHLWKAISNYTHNSKWLITGNILHPIEQGILRETQSRIVHTHRHEEADDLISELSFGFWTNLLNVRYEQVFWPKLLSTVFPTLPRKKRTRYYVDKHFRSIRNLRNRVFHHQRIIHWPNLEERHKQLLESISWLDQNIKNDLIILDRFLMVYRNGKDIIKEQLNREDVVSYSDFPNS